MQTTEQLTITVSKAVADSIRRAVTSGRYPTESAFVEETVEEYWASDLSDDVLEREVLPVYDAMRADPSRALSIDQVRERLARTHAEFIKAS